jgi:hypothetical protein
MVVLHFVEDEEIGGFLLDEFNDDTICLDSEGGIVDGTLVSDLPTQNLTIDSRCLQTHQLVGVFL